MLETGFVDLAEETDKVLFATAASVGQPLKPDRTRQPPGWKD
jgi:hypothetical protein